MKYRTAYRRARLLDPASGLDAVGDLMTENGAITDFGPGIFDAGLAAEVPVIDCGGHCLAPGLVDMRVTIGEPGYEYKETIDSAARAAVAGGVTSIVVLPNTDPVVDDVAGLEFIARRARDAKLVKVFAYAAATRELMGKELTDYGLLGEAGAVGFTDGERAIADALVMRRALSYARTFDHLIMQHPEEPRLAAGGAMNESEISTRLGLPGIPREAETIMIERDLRLVELTGARYHASRISTAESVRLIRLAKEDRLPVTADTAPHYFALTEQDIGDYRTFAKVSPPLRSEADRRAVADGVASGIIDCIASDHRPQAVDNKRQPFAQADFGIVGLETLLPLSLGLVETGSMTLLDLLARMTIAPARLLGLPVGRLAKGAPADLVLFDPEARHKIAVDNFSSKSKNSPFDGRPVTGRVLRTVIDGRTVYES